MKYRFSLLETAFYTPEPDQTGIDIFVDRISGEPTALQYQKKIFHSLMKSSSNELARFYFEPGVVRRVQLSPEKTGHGLLLIVVEICIRGSTVMRRVSK